MLPLLDSLDSQKEAELWKKVRSRIKRPEVALYADWIAEEMKRNSSLFHDYDRGVVRVREKFLDWTRGEGAQAWKGAQAGNYKLKGGSKGKAVQPEVDRSNLPKKYMLVPIAVPGCGASKPTNPETDFQARPF
jgi:tRNA ligase